MGGYTKKNNPHNPLEKSKSVGFQGVGVCMLVGSLICYLLTLYFKVFDRYVLVSSLNDLLWSCESYLVWMRGVLVDVVRLLGLCLDG